MLKIGLTGGIACGKSTALKQLSRLGARTVDADNLARKAVGIGEPAYNDIVDLFGQEILLPGGQIDRENLGQRVFSDSSLRRKLNHIVHPRVIEAEAEVVAQHAAGLEGRNWPPIVIDAALMIEVETFRAYDLLIVVYCPSSVQYERLLRRGGLSRENALNRIKSQMPLTEKVRYADFVIDTSRRITDSREQVTHIFEVLRRRYHTG